MSELPQEFRVETKPTPVRYTLAAGYFAVSGQAADQADIEVVFQLEDGGLSVCRGVPPEHIAGSKASESGPVYRLGDDGPLAVPTGKVFVRLEEGTALDSQHEHFERAGFRAEHPLAYAPHAGWLLPTSGLISDALKQFSRLKEIAKVEAVEPQMLMQSQTR